MRKEYTALELILSDRCKWVRKLSKQRWVRTKDPGHMWVKFSTIGDHIPWEIVKFSKSYETEDWSVSSK